jgi:hypothetical protein
VKVVGVATVPSCTVNCAQYWFGLPPTGRVTVPPALSIRAEAELRPAGNPALQLTGFSVRHPSGPPGVRRSVRPTTITSGAGGGAGGGGGGGGGTTSGEPHAASTAKAAAQERREARFVHIKDPRGGKGNPRTRMDRREVLCCGESDRNRAAELGSRHGLRSSKLCVATIKSRIMSNHGPWRAYCERVPPRRAAGNPSLSGNTEMAETR